MKYFFFNFVIKKLTAYPVVMSIYICVQSTVDDLYKFKLRNIYTCEGSNTTGTPTTMFP